MQKKDIFLITMRKIFLGIVACLVLQGTACAQQQPKVEEIKPVYVSESASEEPTQGESEAVQEAKKAPLTQEQYEEALKECLPFVGMEEKYLSSTALGTAYFYGNNRIDGANGSSKTADIYYYYAGSAVIFTVRIVDGRVYDTTDFFNNPWERKDVFKSHPYVNGEVAGGKITEDIPQWSGDPYDVELYDDPEDFAYDWADEFDSYDDAYEYWLDHAGEF